MPAYAATIFDMDGLLVDSEILWHRAELEILVPLGAPIDADATRATKGMFVREVVGHYYGLAPWEAPSIGEVVDLVLDRVGELVEDVGRLLPGATRALSLCASLGPIALASSTPRRLIYRTLRHFGLDESFEVIHSAEDEPFGKPHPGVFLTTATMLGIAPRACLVFEDSVAGVVAAAAADMGCVAVPAADERGRAAFDSATLVLDSLADLEASWLTARFEPTAVAGRAGNERPGPK
ncbi:MAG TPA: hexitol phosphatase HxpB [Acidimicrobiales bacterium]|nr:hexitol phosphatase HxpB [Acidimicrobiales bacterium]